jgi:hypothetical protein
MRVHKKTVGSDLRCTNPKYSVNLAYSSMASGQNTVGSAAASKFSLVDPLGGAGDDDEKSIQQAVTEEVNNRMGKAVDDLKDKYDRGGKGFDASHDNQVRYANHTVNRCDCNLLVL